MKGNNFDLAEGAT